MAKRKNPVLLRVAIVAVAVLLGMSLNAFQGKSPFKGLMASLQTPAREQAVRPGPEGVSSSGAGEAAPQVQASETGQAPAGPSAKAGASQTADPAQTAGGFQSAQSAAAPGATQPAPEAAARAAGEPARESAAKETGQAAPESVPQEAGQPSPATAAQGTGRPSGETAANAAGQQPAQTPGGQAQPHEPAASKVVSSEGAIRSARLGRQVPLEGSPDASVKKPAGRDQAAAAAAPDKAVQPEMGVQTDKPARPEKAVQPEKAAQPGTAAAEASSNRGQDVPKPPKPGKLMEINTQDRPGEVVLTIVTDMAPEKVTKFLAGKPSRLAVDLWGVWRGVDPANREFDSELIERVRVGWHQDKIRVVIDYRDKDQSGLGEPLIEVSEKGVVVRMAKPGKSKE